MTVIIYTVYINGPHVVLSAGQTMIDMHSHSTPVFFAIGEDLLCRRLPPVTLLPA